MATSETPFSIASVRKKYYRQGMKSLQETVYQIQQAFPGQPMQFFIDDKHPRVQIEPSLWRDLANYLKNQLKFDWLACLTGIDYIATGQMGVVVDLFSTTTNQSFAVKILMSRDNPELLSVTDLWPAANWHEREAFDLLGIRFLGHPDPRRILMADDWIGHPLRKDYVFPRQVHGIPASVELDWQQKPETKK